MICQLKKFSTYFFIIVDKQRDKKLWENLGKNCGLVWNFSFKEKNVADSPTKMDTNILQAAREYELSGKEKEKQIKPKIDKVKRDQESRLVVGYKDYQIFILRADGKPIYMHNRVKASESTKAVK